MPKESIQIAWLKRDIRTQDNWPLATLGNSSAPAIALYVLESDYWKQPYASPSQLAFVIECLKDLQNKLAKLQIPFLILNRPNALEAFLWISDHYEIEKVLAHQETGNQWTYHRDLEIIKWAKAHRIQFKEAPQNLIARGRHKALEAYKRFNGHDWSIWAEQPLQATPTHWVSPKKILPSDILPKVAELFNEEAQPLRQRGGETAATELLRSFLNDRCLIEKGYRIELSSPLHAGEACSRISAHLTWGSLSEKTAVQAAKAIECNSETHRKQIKSFLTRMLWRDQFIQKFEALDWMETRSINPQGDNGRIWNQEFYDRWSTGNTGYPFVDACMRSLCTNQWINFRARAMLVSFAAYGLRLPWQKFDPHLARNFLDYEPGIHYPQVQMQSGTTFGSPPRIYNPIKQSMEKDPTGEFIRDWIPELRKESATTIHQPNEPSHRRPGYPDPIIPVHGLWKSMQSTAKPPKETTDNQLCLL